MPFKEGNKLGKGRIPGSRNVVDNELRNFLKSFLMDNKEDLKTAWKKLTPFQQVSAFKDLMRYVLPQMSSVETINDIERLPEDQLDKLIVELKKPVPTNGVEA